MTPRLIGACTILALLLGCAPAPTMPNTPAIIQVWDEIDERATIRNWKHAGLYWGVAVQADSAYYWVSPHDQVYCVNGVALNISPEIPKAPPSITVDKIKQVISGKTLPHPRSLNITLEQLEERLVSLSKEQESLTSYKLQNETYLTIEEYGSEIETIRLSARLKDDTTPKLTKAMDMLIGATLSLAERKAKLPNSTELINLAKAHINEQQDIHLPRSILYLKLTDTNIFTFVIKPIPDYA